MTVSTIEKPVTSMPHGAATRYSDQALNLLGVCRKDAAAAEFSKKKAIVSLLRFWQQCDADDEAAGRQVGGRGNKSSFQLAYLSKDNDDLPAYWKAQPFETLKTYQKANNNAAAFMEKTRGASPSLSVLPFEWAAEYSISATALKTWASMKDDAKALAETYFEKHGTLKSDYCDALKKICSHEDYKELQDKLLELIDKGGAKFPSFVNELIKQHDIKKAEEAAAERERQRLQQQQSTASNSSNATSKPAGASSASSGNSSESTSSSNSGRRVTPSLSELRSESTIQEQKDNCVPDVVAWFASYRVTTGNACKEFSKLFADVQKAYRENTVGYTEYWEGVYRVGPELSSSSKTQWQKAFASDMKKSVDELQAAVNDLNDQLKRFKDFTRVSGEVTVID